MEGEAFDEAEAVYENGVDTAAVEKAREADALQRLLESIDALKEHVSQREDRKYTMQRRGRTSFIYLANTGNAGEVMSY